MNILPTNKIWWWIATWFGSGLCPKASGTAGSFAALPFAFGIQYYAGSGVLFVASVAIFIIGWWASNEYMKFYPDNHDPKQIVVDEVAGMWLTLSALVYDASNVNMTCLLYFISFVLFRFFDAVKPWPISYADRKIKGGFGVMVDDIFAAMFSILIYLVVVAGVYFFYFRSQYA